MNRHFIVLENNTLSVRSGLPFAPGFGGYSGAIPYLIANFSIDDAVPLDDPHICDVMGSLKTVQAIEEFSISSNKLNIPAQTAPAWGDLAAWDSIGRTRIAGLAMFMQANFGAVNQMELGWDNNQAPRTTEAAFFFVAGTTYAFITVAIQIASGLVTSTDYEFAIILRATGAYLYARGGIYPYWTLLWVDNSSNTATVYAAASNWNAVATSKKLAVWQILASDFEHNKLSDSFSTLAASDGLGHLEADGYGAGHTYAGMSGAAVAGNALYNTPPVGAELLTDGDMEAVGVGAWPEGRDCTPTKETTAPHSGTRLLRITETATNFPYVYQTVLTIGKWYRVIGWARSDGTIKPGVNEVDFGTTNLWVGTTSTNWQAIDFDFVATGTFLGLRFAANADNNGNYVEFDDFTVMELALSDVLRLSDLPNLIEPYCEIDCTIEVGRNLGIALCFDDDTTPTSGITIYSNQDRTKIYIDKYVAGTRTNLAAIAFTYSAGTTLVARFIGTSLYFWYNGAYIGNIVVADVEIVDNTLHGYLHTGGAASYLKKGIIYNTDRQGDFDKYFLGA